MYNTSFTYVLHRVSSVSVCPSSIPINLLLPLFSKPHGYSVGPKYEFVLKGKGIVERVAGTFSGCCQ